MVMRYVHQTSKETYIYVYKVSFTSLLQVSFDRSLVQTHVDWASHCNEVWQDVKTHEHRTARSSQVHSIYGTHTHTQKYTLPHALIHSHTHHTPMVCTPNTATNTLLCTYHIRYEHQSSKEINIYTCTRSLLQVSFTHTLPRHREASLVMRCVYQTSEENQTSKEMLINMGTRSLCRSLLQVSFAGLFCRSLLQVSFAGLFCRSLLQVYPGLWSSKSSQWGMYTKRQKRRIYTCTRSLLHLFYKSLLTGLLYRHM